MNISSEIKDVTEETKHISGTGKFLLAITGMLI